MGNIQTRIATLAAIYDLYAEACADRLFHCRRGCDRCCTRNVTVTALEAFRIAAVLDRPGADTLRQRVLAGLEKPRFQPKTTFNGVVDIGLAGGEPPEETVDPSWWPCPLRTDGVCAVYEVRPFACRCMVSTNDCARSGAADMSEDVLTLNTVFSQAVEHLDVGGTTANLSDALAWMFGPDRRGAYEKGLPPAAPLPGVANRAIRAWMVPPAFREGVHPWRSRLMALFNGSGESAE